MNIIKRALRRAIGIYAQKKIRNERFYESVLITKDLPDNFSCPLSNDEKEEIFKVWGMKDEQLYKEFEIFKFFGGFDVRYLTHYVYLPSLAHKLNNYKYTRLLEHKSLLGRLCNSTLKFPKCLVRVLDGEYYNDKMCQISKEEAVNEIAEVGVIIVKDSTESSGGRSIEKIDIGSLDKTSREARIQQIFEERKYDFVIQECIKQHSSMARFNPTSINTLRVTSLYLNGKFTALSTTLRFGKKGSIVDNLGAGGVIVGVNHDGHLKDYGYDIKYNKYAEYNDIIFKDTIIEQIPSILKQIEYNHINNFSLCKLIGWDICINENNEPIIIEINSSQPGVTGQQLCSGPIFGDRFEEVMEYCNNKKFRYHRNIVSY